MKDQADKLLAAGIDYSVVHSTLHRRAEREALQRIATGACGIVFVTPERLAQPAFSDICVCSLGTRLDRGWSMKPIVCRSGATISGRPSSKSPQL